MKEVITMTMNNRQAAWDYITECYGKFFEDVEKSERAGYPVYTNGAGEWISDLNSRLEINLDGETINVWIEEEVVNEVQKELDAERVTVTLTARDNTDAVKIYTEYNKFVMDWRFWFASGKKYDEDEVLFDKIIGGLIDINVQKASTEILRSGLYIRFKLK